MTDPLTKQLCTCAQEEVMLCPVHGKGWAADRAQKLEQKQPDSDAEVFCRAVVAGVARWEFFSGSTEQGEVCVGGLRYSTRLNVGVPTLHPALRAALERHTCWHDLPRTKP